MTKIGYKPKNNDRRIVKRFALFPITISYNCDRWLEKQLYETKWLETVYIEQHFNLSNGWWDNTSFVTKEDYVKYRTKNK